MKNSLPILALALTLILSSCVSKKKYQETLSNYNFQDSVRTQKEMALEAMSKENKKAKFKNQELEKELYELKTAYDKLNQQSTQSEANYTAQIKATQAELDNKKKILEAFAEELEERENKVKELNSALAYQDSVSKALLSTIERALINFGKDELTVEQRDGKVYVSLSEQLLFQSGSATVNNKGRKALLNLAEVLNEEKEITAMIEGHTDNVPIRTSRYQDNWDLSVIRATEVVRILVWGGKVDPSQLIAAGRGSHLPVASNATREGKKLNRRTEIILTPKLDEIFSLLNKK
ncbi:MAG: OmpA family protein [Bacteroidia bacterium]|nr:OmpA family protein [Bacteroidia bacterium]